MKSQKENKCHERMGMCMGQEKVLNALFLSHLGIDMASEKWEKVFIFARNLRRKRKVGGIVKLMWVMIAESL